jgi:hypothetical protein
MYVVKDGWDCFEEKIFKNYKQIFFLKKVTSGSGLFRFRRYDLARKFWIRPDLDLDPQHCKKKRGKEIVGKET